jgi:flagellar biosynthesis protein FlhF
MKVRRYVAPDMRSALAAARRDQGPEVVILSNRRIDDGVELITADEYDVHLLDSIKPAQRRESADPAPSAALAGKTESASRKPAAESTGDAVAATYAALDAAPEPAEKPAAPAAPRQKSAGLQSEQLWTREPVIEQMRNELKSLRGLLQQQIAGLAWGDLGHSHPLWAGLLRKAAVLGMAPRLAHDIAQTIPESMPMENAWRRFLAVFAKQLEVEDDSLMAQGGAVALVGPTGVGKTTMIAKLAARYALEHGPQSVALITADAQRIAAHEQLRSIGRILGIPVRIIDGAGDLVSALQSVMDRKLVLVDTAGMSHRDTRVEQMLDAIRRCSPLLRTYVVMSAATQGRDLDAILERYSAARPAGVMLTKLDETAYLAPALSAAIMHKLPVAYVSAGQRIPEDLEAARAHSLVSRAVAAASGATPANVADGDLTMEELFTVAEGEHAHP